MFKYLLAGRGTQVIPRLTLNLGGFLPGAEVKDLLGVQGRPGFLHSPGVAGGLCFSWRQEHQGPEISDRRRESWRSGPE